MSAIAQAVTDIREAGAGAMSGRGGTGRHHWPRRVWLTALLGVLLASGLYVFHSLPGNWLPSDEGMLAQSAERVLHGEMPHLNFADVYTGGLSYLHAAGFKLFGVRLLSLRYVLFCFFVLWLPAVFYCASRLVGPVGASVATLLSAAWTIPNYPAAMPSWYNLFFATFGAAALLRYAETRRRPWIAAAGLMGGCSILIKITGLYYVAAGLLFLAVHTGSDGAEPRGGPTRTYRLVIGGGLLLFVAAVIALLRHHLTLKHAYYFLLPEAALAALTYHLVGRAARSGSIARFGHLLWPFLLGTALPLAAFTLPYALRGALPALLHGVFVSPTTRLASASAALPPPPWVASVPAFVLAAIVLVAVRVGSGPRGWLIAALWAGVAGGALLVGGWDYLDQFSWAAVAQATPLLIVAGSMALWRASGAAPASSSIGPSFLMLALAAVCSLTAFPYGAPIYFCYTAPLALLALIALLQLPGRPPQPLTGLLAGSYLTLAMLALNAQSLRDVGIVMHPAVRLVPLRVPRAGLLVRPEDAARYQSLVDTLMAHARGGVAYAGPDSPEIYFLAGLRNPTRLIFDFLEPGARNPDSLLALVDRERMTAVVIRSRPEFSRPLEPAVLQGFAERFPHEWARGDLTVRWRE